MLKRRGTKHDVLNAKFHEKESGIIAQAGKSGAVTIATNMAGRGTDILLGGTRPVSPRLSGQAGLNPAEVDSATYDAALTEAKGVTNVDHEEVVEAGGSTSSAPSATRAGGSTTSCAAAPVARATRARRGSISRSTTT